MRRNTLSSIALAVIIIMMGACNNDTWDELPESISRFVSEYFPFGELESYSDNGKGVEIVRIKKGATLTFNSDYEWTDVNGNGVVLPVQFLFDQLPSALYSYLEAREMQHSVYRVVRSPDYITVDLLDTTVTYNQNTGEITYPEGLVRTARLISALGN